MSNSRYCRKGILIPWTTVIDALKSYGIAMPDITEYIEARKGSESLVIYYRGKAARDEGGTPIGAAAEIDSRSWHNAYYAHAPRKNKEKP